jgi:hypothetical protein
LATTAMMRQKEWAVSLGRVSISVPLRVPIEGAQSTEYDSLSILTSHEIDEALTDPSGSGWYDVASGTGCGLNRVATYVATRAASAGTVRYLAD